MSERYTDSDWKWGRRYRKRVDLWVARDELGDALRDTWLFRELDRFLSWLDDRLAGPEGRTEAR